MTYPGSPELSAQAQERVMTTFRQIVSKIQDGLLEEARVGLDFVLRLDPTFAPGLELQRQLSSGRDSIDLTALIAHLDAPDTGTVNLLLVEAVEEFNQRNYLEAKEKVGKVLLDLPGHAEARNLLGQVEEALKIETQVGQFLTQAREAIDRGDPEEAANFVMMAQALDPHHRGIQGMLAKLQSQGPDRGAPTEPPSSAQPPPARDWDPQPAVDAPPDDAPPAHQPPPSAPAEAPPPAEPSGDDQDSWNIANAFSEESGAPTGPEADSGLRPPSEDSGISDLFAIDSDDDMAMAGSPSVPASPSVAPPQPPQVSAPVAPSRPEPALERSGPAFDDSSSDLGDLFQSDPDLGNAFAPDDAVAPSFDPVDDRKAQIQAMVDEAQAAWKEGKASRARDLVEGVLATDPGHNEALDLIELIEGAEAPIAPDPVAVDVPPPETLLAPEIPVEDDADPSLFAQEFAPPEPLSTQSVGDDFVHDDRAGAASGSRSGSRSPLRLALLLGGGVVIVLVTMWLGRGLFSSGVNAEEERAQAVTQVLQEAQTFFDQGKTEEALHLLQSFPAEGIEKQRIDKRIARYQESLAPPPPTPIPQAFIQGRALLDEGRWLDAYAEVDSGLRDNPDDPGLRGLADEVAAIEPEVVSLYASLNNRDFGTAASISRDLERQHTNQNGFAQIYDRCLFNAALADLRTYNLVGARNYLETLKARRPRDAEVMRILDFISSYSNRSVDMQLEIFVGSLEER